MRRREDSRLLRGRAERDGNVQDRPAVLRVQGRVRRGRALGRAGQELDADQREQRAAPAAAAAAVHDDHHHVVDHAGSRAVLGHRGRTRGQQTVSRRVRERAVRAVLRRRGRRRVLSRRGQQLLRDRARGRRLVAAASAAAAFATGRAVPARDHHHRRGHRATVAQVPRVLSAQPDGRVLRTAVRARVVHVHVQTRLRVLRQHQSGRAVGHARAQAQAPAARAHHDHHDHAAAAARRTTRVPGLVHRPVPVVHVFQ